MTVTEFVDGPLWYFALAVFFLGIAWRLVVILANGWRGDLSRPRRSGLTGSVRALFSRFAPAPGIGRRIGLHLTGGYLFHLGLFALLLFAAPHVAFYAERLSLPAWQPMPHWAFVLVSELAFIGLMLLWLNRVLNPVTRLISSTGDHLSSILTFLVMLSGCLALEQAHEPLRVLHFFLVEVLMIYFPFSSLMHAFTFVLSREALGYRYGRRGVPV